MPCTHSWSVIFWGVFVYLCSDWHVTQGQAWSFPLHPGSPQNTLGLWNTEFQISGWGMSQRTASPQREAILSPNDVCFDCLLVNIFPSRQYFPFFGAFYFLSAFTVYSFLWYETFFEYLMLFWLGISSSPAIFYVDSSVHCHRGTYLLTTLSWLINYILFSNEMEPRKALQLLP